MQGVGQVANILAFVSRVNDPSFQLSDIAVGLVQLETQIKLKSLGEVTSFCFSTSCRLVYVNSAESDQFVPG